MNDMKTPEGRDENLWQVAKKRAAFKKSLLTYVAVNIFLWALWYFTHNEAQRASESFPWPLWVTLGWGLGMTFQYADAYLFPKSTSVEKEYDKLKNKQDNL